jgi:endonuclease YncB( thermonuclease family)
MQNKIHSVRVIDGDTVEVMLNVFQNQIFVKVSIRLARIDAPELSTEAGKRVRDAVVTWINLNREFLTHVVIGPDKFHGRYIGDIFNGDEYLTSYLLSKRYVKVYDGREPRSWTEEELKLVETRTMEDADTLYGSYNDNTMIYIGQMTHE